MSEIFKFAFPKATYLDNAASTKPHPILLDNFRELWDGAYVNPSAGNPAARALRKNIDEQTKRFLTILNASEDRVIWTSGGTEANNLAIFSSVAPDNSPNRLHLVTSQAEHPSLHQPLEQLAAAGAKVSYVPVNADGAIDPDRLSSVLRPETNLLAIGHVQGETGAVQNLCEIRKILDQRAPSARLHIDAVQALTKVDIPWREARVDSASFSGHKFHAFGGVGALLTRKDCQLTPQVFGGGQQDNLRSGSLDGAGILSFLIAANQQLGDGGKFRNQLVAFNARLREGFSNLTDPKGNPIPFQFISPQNASPHILNVSLPGYEGAVLMRILEHNGVIVSTGSACSAERSGPSKVITAMGHTGKVAYGILRISLGLYTTEADIEAFHQALREAIICY